MKASGNIWRDNSKCAGQVLGGSCVNSPWGTSSWRTSPCQGHSLCRHPPHEPHLWDLTPPPPLLHHPQPHHEGATVKVRPPPRRRTHGRPPTCRWPQVSASAAQSKQQPMMESAPLKQMVVATSASATTSKECVTPIVAAGIPIAP